MIKKALQAYAEQERQIVKLMAVTSKWKKEKRHRVPLTEGEIDLLIACKIAGIHTPEKLYELTGCGVENIKPFEGPVLHRSESWLSRFVRWAGRR